MLAIKAASLRKKLDEIDDLDQIQPEDVYKVYNQENNQLKGSS